MKTCSKLERNLQFIRLGMIFFFLGREAQLLEKIDKLCNPQAYPQISNSDEEAAAFYPSFMLGHIELQRLETSMCP